MGKIKEAFHYTATSGLNVSRSLTLRRTVSPEVDQIFSFGADGIERAR